MTLPTASVVVVSRGRPGDLARCLGALAQQDHPGFEVVVVADPAGLAAVAATGLAVKAVAFDEANISVARNLGLAQAAGEVVAFIDDDACAEPTWLSRLVAVFADARVMQATGFVRGRNGISFQWTASEVDRFGEDHALAVPQDRVSLHEGSGARAVKTVGTNCAFRAGALRAAGGFDPAFRFYLDEADVNLRLAARGGLTAVVPGAQVHHAFAASERRRADRVPLSLHEIGASTAVFLRRHAPEAAGALPEAMLRRERARLWRHLLRGRIGPGRMRALMAGLRAGWEEGRGRASALAGLPGPETPFAPLPGTGPRPGLWLTAGVTDRGPAEALALSESRAGRVVTLLLLSRGFRRHRQGFTGAFWLQTGGVHGRSDRKGPVFWRISAEARCEKERQRLSPIRPVNEELRTDR